MNLQDMDKEMAQDFECEVKTIRTTSAGWVDRVETLEAQGWEFLSNGIGVATFIRDHK